LVKIFLQGVWAEDICLAVRLLPRLSRHAKIYPLIVRCEVDKENSNVVRVTLVRNHIFFLQYSEFDNIFGGSLI